jgi:Fe-S-cluster-containing hydrogenase component 2
VKSNLLFFNTENCSGCLLCEMACSLIQKGECSRDGEERCLEICNQKALKFVPREEATQVLTDKKWFPCPLTGDMAAMT